MFYHRPLFSLRISHLNTKKEKNFTVAVSKKSYKRAVDRNKLKRRIRAVVRSKIKKTSPDFYIFSAKRGALEMPFQELKSEIEVLLSKIK